MAEKLRPAVSSKPKRDALRAALSIIAAVVLSVAIAGPSAASDLPLSASDVALRAAERSRGSDRSTAVAIGGALLANPLPAQLVQIRCERAGTHRICGLVVSGVKFKRPLDRQDFVAEVRGLIEGAFRTAPIEEVDLWTTVPLSAGQGAVVSGDAAVPTSATVFAITVPRTALGRLDRQLASGQNVFWDPSFADSLAKGTPQ